MKIEGYEEISEEEYENLGDTEGAVFEDWETDKKYYFKKVQKFPIVFEDDIYKIEISERMIEIKIKGAVDYSCFAYDKSFPLLVKAVEKAKGVMNDDKRKRT